ncbi:MAG: HesA/MoeB/ThiF family protein [Planctomycetota bacterium]|jgi:sulfur carrier protein ThiS adenylyltransferase
MSEVQQDERYSRQGDIVPTERIAQCKATVIGVGAIGRQVALQLAAIGIAWLQLIDPDRVEWSNLASQGYLEGDMGKLKVNATLDLCWRINANSQINAVPERFRRSTTIGNVVFCCVDRINVRRLIWESVQDKVSFFVDGRMSAEVMRILTACDTASRKHYPSTLFSPDEAFVGPCTAKTTIYCANIAAGLMLAQFTKYLRQLPIDCDIQLNLLASELSVGGV